MGKLKTITLGLLPLILLLICLRSCKDGSNSSNTLDRSVHGSGTGTPGIVEAARTGIGKSVAKVLLKTALRLPRHGDTEYTYQYLLDEGHFNHRRGERVNQKILSLNPGIAFTPQGFGADIRFCRIGSWGAQAGAYYFPKDKEVTWGVGPSYNLEKATRGWTKNTWIFVNYTPKTILGGIRIDL